MQRTSAINERGQQRVETYVGNRHSDNVTNEVSIKQTSKAHRVINTMDAITAIENKFMSISLKTNRREQNKQLLTGKYLRK